MAVCLRTEVDSLEAYWTSYPGVRELLFASSAPPPYPPNLGGNSAPTENPAPQANSAPAESGTPPELGAGGPRSAHENARYLAFSPAVTSKAAIKTLIEAAPGVIASHAAIHAALDAWWADNVRLIEALPGGNVYSLRRRFMQSIAATVTPYGLLAVHTVRGAMASYFKTLEADFKSIAASGWNAELIPDDEILASQFPDVLAAQAERQARIAELRALFAAGGRG